MRRARVIVGIGLVVVTALGVYAWVPLSSYLKPGATVLIADPTRSIDLKLRAPENADAIYSIRVVGTGRIEGDAEVSLMLNGRPYKTEHLRGPIVFTWGGDWYASEATVRYTPTSVKSGSVKLRYRFFSL